MFLTNSKGKIFYGMHFYPGVAEYQEPGQEPYRVYLNEDTIRGMDPTFAGRPIFVEHVDGVDPDIDELRKDADGWVIESFYNSADGKHWVKFIVVSERGERGILNGMRLSNAYVPTSFKEGGLWNGVSYLREITSGEYEHLAIVKNPRYEESVILTPDQFKKYNEDKVVELKRLANSKDPKGESPMKLNFFKRAKVENSADLEGMSVVLPKSGKEITIAKLVNDADEKAVDMNAGLADMGHKVKMHDGSYCNVGDLLAKHKALSDELEMVKKKKEDSDSEIEEGSREVGDRGGDKSLDNEDDGDGDDDDKKENEDDAEEAKKEKKKNELELAQKKAEAKKKADALRFANSRAIKPETTTVEFASDKLERGKSRYGSN